MRLTDRLASLPPVVVTIAFLALFIGGALGMNMFAFASASWAVAYSLVMALVLLPILAWHYSIYRATSDRSLAVVGHRGRRAFLFLLCAVATSVFLTTFPIWYAANPEAPHYRYLGATNTTAMIIGCLSYFAAIWASANALTRFDEQKKPVELHKTLGTFFLQLYFPIGIWFTYRRIKNALATPLPA